MDAATTGTDGATTNTETSAEATPSFQESLGDAYKDNEAFSEFTEVGNLADAYLKNSNDLAELQNSQPVIPEAYEFDMEGLDEGAIDKFKGIGKDLGLTQEQAAGVLEFSKQQRLALAEQTKADETAKEADQTAKLESAIEKMKGEQGANYEKYVAGAERATNVFASEALKGLLTTIEHEGVLLGNHPVMIELFNTLSTKMSEDSFTTDGTSNTAPSRKVDSTGKAMLNFTSMQT